MEPQVSPHVDGPFADDFGGGWTFLTNHAHVLLVVSKAPDVRQREVAALVGITENAVQRILRDLEDGGYLRRERIGRRNRYHVQPDKPLRHPLERDHSIAEILELLNTPGGTS